jgi:hypothetical protein
VSAEVSRGWQDGIKRVSQGYREVIRSVSGHLGSPQYGSKNARSGRWEGAQVEGGPCTGDSGEGIVDSGGARSSLPPRQWWMEAWWMWGSWRTMGPWLSYLLS